MGMRISTRVKLWKTTLLSVLSPQEEAQYGTTTDKSRRVYPKPGGKNHPTVGWEPV